VLLQDVHGLDRAADVRHGSLLLVGFATCDSEEHFVRLFDLTEVHAPLSVGGEDRLKGVQDGQDFFESNARLKGSLILFREVDTHDGEL
jgi:hypothetical protein